MNTKRNSELLTSLVGASIEYKVKGEVVTADVTSTRSKIESYIKKAKEWGGFASIVLLAEMSDHYRFQDYYPAVRSALIYGRLRPIVEEYMAQAVDVRVERLKTELDNHSKKRGAKNAAERELLVEAVRYLCETYTRRLSEFKALLSREEYVYCS